MINSRQQGGNIKRQAEPGLQMPVKLGDMVGKIMDHRILPQQVKFESIVQLWSELLPVELRQHCRIIDISAGRLKVLVDSPSYMYDLQLRSSEILAELRRCCPQVRIKIIKFALA